MGDTEDGRNRRNRMFSPEMVRLLKGRVGFGLVEHLGKGGGEVVDTGANRGC